MKKNYSPVRTIQAYVFVCVREAAHAKTAKRLRNEIVYPQTLRVNLRIQLHLNNSQNSSLKRQSSFHPLPASFTLALGYHLATREIIRGKACRHKNKLIYIGQLGILERTM
jgi:hypothetical protein